MTKKKEIFLFFLFIPFFKLLSFGMFQENHFHEHFFTILENLYDVGRILAATYGFCLFVKFKASNLTKQAKLLIMLFCSQFLACLLNRSIDLFILVKIYAYIGFVLILNYEFKKSANMVLRAIRALFGILSITAIITTIIFPLGFLHGDRVYTAVYFLGGKNASFPFYYVFLLSTFLYSITRSSNHKLPFFWPLILVFMFVAALICRSANSMLAIMIIFTISLLYDSLKFKVDTFIPAIALYIILGFIYVGASIPAVGKLLAAFGRNATFSHRTTLWGQAFGYISSNPLFGAGHNITFSLDSTQITDHAHSWYLDVFSKYGIFFLFIFLIIVLVTAAKTSKSRYQPIGSYAGLFLLVYLLHMGFDDYNYNFIIIILMTVDSALDLEDSKYNLFRIIQKRYV